ncbi:MULTISPECIES: CPBP family intramembrane glutamic endopeptidase [Natrialbaceae]|uniref:CPBP family intramembrane glutamic endopeptidase n=1 Tax=Natrialbaceae TaxID=1644061 RepID=UPI00207C411B|nr:CPBP family intramembrane glutamic endopeptidase [Natronococcus sp. CG52]
MSETVRSGGEDSRDDSFVPSLGVVPATVAMAAAFVPVRGGADDPFVWLAAAFTVVTVVAFLARRHGALEPELGGLTAAISSLLVVLCSGYALNQGVSGAATVPGLGWTISMLFLALVAAGAAIGFAAADYAGVSSRGLVRRTLRFSTMAGLGFAGLISMAFVSAFLLSAVMALGGGGSDLDLQFVQYSSTAIGLGSIAAAYLLWRGHGLSYLDLERPDLRSVLWTVGGLAMIFGALVAISLLMSAIGVDTAEHGTAQQAEQNPELLVVIIPAMILIVGPFEELLYRNVIQKSLYDTFSRYGAVVVTSVIFAGVHVAAYGTAGAGEVLASLGVLFGLSLILGFVYERTDNLMVPAIVHGCFNAAQMAMIYLA